jgi:hypothetical protein
MVRGPGSPGENDLGRMLRKNHQGIEMTNWFTDFIELDHALLEKDDFVPHELVIMWSKEGVVIGLEFDICDIRTICLLCGNGTDCCTC